MYSVELSDMHMCIASYVKRRLMHSFLGFDRANFNQLTNKKICKDKGIYKTKETKCRRQEAR